MLLQKRIIEGVRVAVILILLILACVGVLLTRNQPGQWTELYAYLFIIPILIASFYFGRIAGLSVALMSSLVTGSLAIGTPDLLESPLIQRLLFQILIFNAVAIVTTELAGREREQKKQYQDLFEGSPFGLYRTTPSGIILDVNPALVHMLGYPDRALLIGRSNVDIYLNPEDRKQRRAFIEHDGVMQGFEIPLRKHDGTIIWVRDTIWASRDLEGVVQFYEGSLEDITERRRTEETLHEREAFLNNVVENIPDMIFVKDAQELRFVRFNKAGEDLLGYSRDDLLGKNDYDFFPKEEADFFTVKDREVMLMRQLRDIPEEKIQTKNMGERILHTKKITLVDKEGNPQYLLGISEDITVQKRAEDEIIHKTDELRAAYEQLTANEEELRHNYEDLAKSQQALVQARKKLNLLNTVTFQDIQTAVFSLSGYLQLETENPTEEHLQQFRDKQMKIIRTITEYLKLAAQYQNVGLKPPTWQNVYQTFLYGISHLDLSRLSRTIEVRDLAIYADPLLEQVFFTLAENVVLHGKTATEIALRYQETTDGLVLIFEDNGVGIPDTLKENIFSRKYEEKKGLGLFLVREILEITGITIKETGIYGQGARFEMKIPTGQYQLKDHEE